jgi:allantoinase
MTVTARAARTPRTRGTDNPYTNWSPLPTRGPLRWPGGARVAVGVVVSIEHLELQPAADALVAPSAVGYGPYPAAFQIVRVSEPEYGSRVGVFRILAALDQQGIRPMVAMDTVLARDRPRLVREFTARQAEFLGHGPALSRTLGEPMPPETERQLIQDSLDTLQLVTGQRPAGWLGAEYGESTRTVQLLSELNVRYVCDWPNDEQPYRMNAGPIVALPVAVDLDDVMAEDVRKLPAWRWSRMVREALDRLCADGSEHGRVMLLNLHAHVSGQPFRIKYVTELLAAIAGHEGVWTATGSEIVDWFTRQGHEEPAAHAH